MSASTNEPTDEQANEPASTPTNATANATGSGGSARTGTGGAVRLGFLGAGNIARGSLAPAAHAADGVVVQAVAARSRERAQALEPAGRAYDDYRALLADDDVDLVYVALDNGGHLPWTLAALAAGKHVICEKPLALTPADLERMQQAAAAADRMLVEGFWYRWHPRTRRLEQLLQQGALGPVHRVETDFTFDGPADGDLATQYRLDPTRGGGGLYDVGCYALSAACLTLGPLEHVESVTARRGVTGVDLELEATLRPAGTTSAGSSVAHVRCGISGAARQRVAVSGEAAHLEFGDPAFTAIHAPVTLTITTPDGAVREEEFAGVDPYRLMIEAVAARIRGEDAFLPGTEHSRQVAASTHSLFAALGAPGLA